METLQNKYRTVAETAARWGLQVRVVQEWCRTGRISGASRMGRNWLIPVHAERPDDRRLRGAGQASMPTYSVLSPCSTLNCLGMDDVSLAEKLPDGEHRTLLLASLAKLRGNYAEALEMARTIPETSEFYVGALLCRFRAAASLGNIAEAQAVYWRLVELRWHLPDVMPGFSQVEVALLVIDATLYSHRTLPRWFIRGNFQHLPARCRPLALYARIRYLHGTEQIEQMLGYAQATLAFIQGSGSSIELYLELLVATALLRLNRSRDAESFVEYAAQRAVPRGMLGPFAECMSVAGGVVERVFASNWPHLSPVLRRMQADVWRGWVLTHNAILHRNVTTELSRAEWHVAFLAAWGFSNQEIATRLDISLGMVKRRMQSILTKLDVHNRREIAPYVRWARHHDDTKL